MKQIFFLQAPAISISLALPSTVVYFAKLLKIPHGTKLFEYL